MKKSTSENLLDRQVADALLKRTSRSFYVTIRVLPRRLRGPVGLAYLAARATDTVADSPAATSEECLELLEMMAQDLESDDAGAAGEPLRALAGEHAADHEGEAALLTHWDDLLEAVRVLQPFDRAELRRVLAIIIDGQHLDLKRFGKAPASGSGSSSGPLTVNALDTPEDLEDYTYKVAGCVGEFWTRLCAHHLWRWSDYHDKQMLNLGRRFGEGLQLVNILRDIAKDACNGRCYLPRRQLAELGIAPQDLAALTPETFERLQPLRRTWAHTAETRLRDGWRYTLANRKYRLRLACALPALLGFATLHRLSRAHREEFLVGVKVPRHQTVRLIRRATLFCPSKTLLQTLRENPNPDS